MKKIILITLIITICMISSLVYAVSFSDLNNEHWAYEPIIEMANKGILDGYPDGTFLPNKSITRAEFAKIIVLTLGLKDDSNNVNVFDDIDDSHWSYNYVRIASNYLSGYSNGSQIYFMPDEQAVREDMAVAIVLATNLQNKQYDLSTLDRFSDKDSISENLRKYVAIAVENNLMRGNANGTFNPKGKLTRAEVSQLMFNTTKELEKIVIGDNLSSIKVPKLSSSVESGNTIKSYESVKLFAKDTEYVEKLSGRVLSYAFEYDGETIKSGSYKDGDTIKVNDIMMTAVGKALDLDGKTVTLKLYFDNKSENKKEYLTVYTYKCSKEIDNGDNDSSSSFKTPKLSSNMESGSTIRSYDMIKLSAKDTEDVEKLGGRVLRYSFEYKGEIIKSGSYKDGDRITVNEIIMTAIGKALDLDGKTITLKLYYDNEQINKKEYLTTYSYKYEGKNNNEDDDSSSSFKTPKLSSNIESGSTIRWYESITLYAKDTEDVEKLGGRVLRYSFDYKGDIIKAGSYKDVDVINVHDLLIGAKGIALDLDGKTITLKLYYLNQEDNKEEYLVTYTYTYTEEIAQ